MTEERKDRNELGQFVKGHKVPSPHKGRPARADVLPFLNAVTEAYTPEQVQQMLKDTYEMAYEQKDWKGMYTVASLILAYAIGKPVQRSLTASIDADDIRKMFSGAFEEERAEAGEEGAEDVVEVEASPSE